MIVSAKAYGSGNLQRCRKLQEECFDILMPAAVLSLLMQVFSRATRRWMQAAAAIVEAVTAALLFASSTQNAVQIMLASGGVSYTGIYSSALNAMTVTVGSGVKAGDLWVGTDQGVNAVTLSSDDGKQQEISISGTVGRTQEDLTLATGANEYKLTASDGSTAMSGSETGVGIRKQIAFARVMPSQAEIGGLMGHQIENEESTGSSASMNLIINRIPEEMPFNSIKVNGAEAVFDRNFGMRLSLPSRS